MSVFNSGMPWTPARIGTSDAWLDECGTAESCGQIDLRQRRQHESSHGESSPAASNKVGNDSHDTQDSQRRTEDARSQVTGEEHAGGDVAGVRVEVRDRRLVSERTQPE